MRRLAIIHFNPIELYPPVMNWLNFIGEKDQSIEVQVFTMRMDASEKPFQPNSNSIKISRSGQFKRGAIGQSYRSYLAFYLNTTMKLMSWKPDIVLYYETLSSLPALVYKKIVNQKSRLFVHYHEYSSQAEYEQGGFLSRKLHEIEKKFYAACEWISQTNQDRMNLFLLDNKVSASANQYLLPNYPPKSWWSVEKKNTSKQPLKIVYIGALSIDTMYVKELVSWVLEHHGDIIFDVYSSNITKNTKEYLASANKEIIRYHEGVDYFSLPEILRKYDVGVILYKGHIPNYIYNAPNKLFEYMASGLDVWFPENMKSSIEYGNSNSIPKIIPVDFARLHHFDWHAAVNHQGLTFRNSEYFAENVLESLWKKMLIHQ